MAKTKRPSSPIPPQLYPPPAPPGSYHPVVAGDNFGKIARLNGLGVWDLIYGNFKTRDPDEINWYMENYLGCWETDEPGYNYRLSPKDRHGQPMRIYVPPKPEAAKCPYSAGQLYGYYPQEPTAMLYKQLGWTGLFTDKALTQINLDYVNTCAIRVSICLIRCGMVLHTIPFVQVLGGGVLKVKNAIIGVKEGESILIRVGGPQVGYSGHNPGMVDLLAQQWGMPARYKAEGGSKLDPKDFAGRAGVMVFLHQSSSPMGHVDVLYSTDKETRLAGNNYVYQSIQAYQEVFFWEANNRNYHPPSITRSQILIG